ncbi:MAG: hypothetical protein V2A54_10445 [Bacteroidota bacterium]
MNCENGEIEYDKSLCASSYTYRAPDNKILIHICSGFENDKIKLYLNDSLMLSEVVTSDKSNGVTGEGVTIDRVKGQKLKIKINGSCFETLVDEKYPMIRLSYSPNSEKKVYILYTKNTGMDM